MKKIFALMPILIVSLFSSAYAQEPIIMEQLSPSGKVLVKLQWLEVYPNKIHTFHVSFHDPKTKNLLDEIRINYNFFVMQHGYMIEFYQYNLAKYGTGEFDILFPKESKGLAIVVVELKKASDHGHAIIYEEEVMFWINLVPELGIMPVYTPPKQIEHGIIPENVICKEGLELIIKNNNSPACTSPQTAEKLKSHDWSIMSPLKQTAFGITPENVICKEGLELIIKNNQSPACVTSETAASLEELGWGVVPLS